MSRKFFTADFHLGSNSVLLAFDRPYKSVEQMNERIVRMCNSMANPDDTIIHIGDLCKFSNTDDDGLKINPNKFIKSNIIANFININGNHDAINKVKSVCSCMRTQLGKYKDVSISHYPSYDLRAKNSFIPGDIHLCGHVHNKWKYYIDKENKVLNINMGIDAWLYRIVSEEKLIEYIDKIMRKINSTSGII